jgi:prepilin-type processing-associated H-X9-DG protein
LVVTAIIALLAALILPAFSVAKGRAQSAFCKNLTRQMGQALEMYVHENANKYPFYLGPAGLSYGDAVGLEGKARGLVYWSSKLYPYYAMNWTDAGYRCPAYKGITTGPVPNGGADRFGSYTYNLWGAQVHDSGQGKHFGLGPCLFWAGDRATSEAQVAVPSEMLSIGESRWQKNGRSSGGSDAMKCGLEDSVATRHGKDYNQLFCDGHVAGMDPMVLFSPAKAAAMWNYDHQPHPESW